MYSISMPPHRMICATGDTALRTADKAARAVAVCSAGRPELNGAVLQPGAGALLRAAGLPQPRPRSLIAARALARL